MMCRCTFACIICFFFYSQAFSQSVEELLCRIIDSETEEPVSYATILFKNKSGGIIANIEGDFRIPKKFKTDKDTLIISSIGYETKRIILSELKEESINIIQLKPQIELLDQIVVTGKKTDLKELSARAIIEKAINKIPLNYPVDPFSHIDYYRDYQVINKEYYNLYEGIIEVFDNGFLSDKLRDSNNNTVLYSYKLNDEFNNDITISNAIYNDSKKIENGEMGNSFSNELTILNLHNVIRNYKSSSFSFVDVFKDDFIKNHSFTLKKIIYLDNEPIYEIAIKARNDEDKKLEYSIDGFIYISKNNFSIHKFNYKFYKAKRDVNLLDISENLQGISGDKDEKLMFEVEIEYKNYKDKMYLNYITFNNAFFIVEQNALKVLDIIYDIKKKSFFITFNKGIDDKSIKRKSNFKLYLKKRRLNIDSIELSQPNQVKVKIEDWSISSEDNEDLNKEGFFTYKIKNIKDKFGFKIDKVSRIKGYQFRELFVQRIFPNKTPNNDLFFVRKDKSLKEAQINELNTEDYWLNSPLKTTDN